MASTHTTEPSKEQLSSMEVEANKFAEALAASFAAKPADEAKPAPEAGTNHGASAEPVKEAPTAGHEPATKPDPSAKPVPPPKPVFGIGPVNGTKPELRVDELIYEPKVDQSAVPTPHPTPIPAPQPTTVPVTAPVAAPRTDPGTLPVAGARADPDTRPVIQARVDHTPEPIHDLVKVAAEVALIEEIKQVLSTPPHEGEVHGTDPIHGHSHEPIAHHHPEPIDSPHIPRSGFLRFLYAPHGDQADSLISAVEVSTNLKREKIVYVVGATLAALLIFASFAQLLCNLIGFAYPAYVSVKAIRSPSKDDDTKWLKYWTVFGFSCVVDFFAESIMHFFPLFYLVKALFLTYLYLPQTGGAEYLYARYVDPAVSRFDAWFEARYADIKEE